MEALSSLPHELTNALDDFIKTLEGFTKEPPKCPGLFSDWAEKHSVTMIKAARRIYDDRGQTLPTLPDEPEFSYVIATHYLVVYARNLEILSENVNGLTTWEPIQRLDIPWHIRARALVTAMVGLFPQVSLNKVSRSALFLLLPLAFFFFSPLFFFSLET